MHFSSNLKKLLKGVSIIANLCQSKTTKPILQDIKITTDNDGVFLLGTDLEVAVKCFLKDVNVKIPGTVVVPAIKFMNMLREISDQEIEISTDQRVLSIKANDANFKLICDDPEEFPIIPDYDFSDAVEIDANKLHTFANKTLYAAAKDMSCYAYNGVLIELYEDGIKFVATDGRRLSIAGDVEIEQENILSSSVVPVKGLNQIIKSMEEEDEKILFKTFKNQFITKLNTIEIAARLLEGEFPNYKEAIPKENNIFVKIDKDELTASLRKASITAGNEVRSVKFTFKPGNLQMFSQQEGIGESQANVPIEYEGNKFSITFNPDFVLDYLKVMDNMVTEFCFKDEGSACMIKDNEKEFYIVMPITAK